MSLRGRVATLVATAVAVAVAVLSLSVYLGIRSQLSDDFDNALLARAQAAVQGALANPNLLAAVPADALGDVRVAVVASDGSAVVAAGGTVSQSANSTEVNAMPGSYRAWTLAANPMVAISSV